MTHRSVTRLMLVSHMKEVSFMKKGLTEVVFILDRSGSMSGLEADTIGGYNSMLEKQKTGEGEVIISTVLFDDKIEVIHDRKPITEVKPISGEEYYVRGCTALLDAIGGAIHHIGHTHKEADPNDVPEKTLFIITTDGMENASKKYTYDKIKKMVEKKKKKLGWEFIFMGANIDAVSVAGRFGVDKSRAVRYNCDSVGTMLNFKVMSDLVGCARASSSSKMMTEALDTGTLLEDIENDYEKRHK